MNAVVDGLKTNPITKFDIYDVAAIRDYSNNITSEGSASSSLSLVSI